MEQDLLIIADATGSMSSYLDALHTSLPQILSISALTDCFSKIGLLAYRDYSDRKLLEWSGWLDQDHDDDGDSNKPDLIHLARNLKATGGGDFPEATKTALAHAYSVMRADANTVILLFTDAPPHHVANSGSSESSNRLLEIEALSKPDSYCGYGPLFLDWVSAAHQFRHGEKRAQIFCMLDPDIQRCYGRYYNYLCAITDGACLHIKMPAGPLEISKATIEVLLAWMDVGNSNDSVTTIANLSCYKSTDGILDVRNEIDAKADCFFEIPTKPSYELGLRPKIDVTLNISETEVTAESLRKSMPRKKALPITNFAISWSTSAKYRLLAVKHLKDIIAHDITAITLNPVFGSLWRTICSDRTHEARDELTNLFSAQVAKISNTRDRELLKSWLEESYDYSGEVLGYINSVPETDRYPCVFLDPTLTFTQTTDDAPAPAPAPNMGFSRPDLLEIGRSCDPKILKRLSQVLTRLTYVKNADELPEHIALAGDEKVPKIPIILASDQYKRRFWKILLHLIIPGTMLSARPAALLAALSLRIGITPLIEAAERELLSFRNLWADVEVPETWAVSCLDLLLSADQVYRERYEERTGNKENETPSSLIKPDDKQLFERLISYKMLELNLQSTLRARVGWTPSKNLAPIGHLIVCELCHYPRSVTIMGPNKQCGVCLGDSEGLDQLHIRVSKEDEETTLATWVECIVQTCRAQYVVYDVNGLNVRPKCHYCRLKHSSPAAAQSKSPWIECKRCLNRVIWPEEYRPASLGNDDFACFPCTAGLETVVEVETTANKLADENSLSWLVSDAENPGACPFSNRSLYHTISTIGIDQFNSRMDIFPTITKPLTLKGKSIRNVPELISTLRDLVSGRRTERVDCSLCFSTFAPAALNLACGRHGCTQRICKNCLHSWYGINGPGRVINTGSLACPFCRRLPAGRTLAKYGMGIQAVGNLAHAIRDQGTMIYAWCRNCGHAKPYMERACAQGPPPTLLMWACEGCEVAQGNSAPEQQMKECPNCGTMTEKISGCGHITCPVENCFADWCYFCGDQFSNEDIYAHMNDVHGGIYGDSEDEDEDDY